MSQFRSIVRASLCFAVLLAATPASQAQNKIKIEKADDLPRFTYVISGKLDDLIRDDARFEEFAVQVRRDTESVLDKYDIGDKATKRSLLSLLAQIDFLEGNYVDAGKRVDEVQALEEKPADKLLSGLRLRAMLAAAQSTGSTTSDAYLKAVGQNITHALDAMPYAVVGTDVKQYKGSAEIASEALAMGRIQNVLQPTVDKAGALSSDLAPAIVGTRYLLKTVLPMKQTLIDTYTAYLATHNLVKPDIWAARNVELPPTGNYHPVNVVVWDSGVDVSLFPGRLLQNADGTTAVIGFDKFEKPANTNLMPLPDEFRANVPNMIGRIKGFSDLRANIDSPEASELKSYLSGLQAADYKRAIEELNLNGDYVHGTHVAGITSAGNPYVRLGVARIEFGYTLLPDPCPSEELARAHERNVQAYVDFMEQHKVRVVNMSWGGSVKAFESDLELCNMGTTVDERKALARHYFDMEKIALTRAMGGAKDILFIAAAGNSNTDASFGEFIPAGIELPNLLTVGAVDQAGDEASFTSYGKTVVVDANGLLVDSVVPGGRKVPLSGTSMASPQVANLAAKILAVDPALTPEQVIKLIRSTSDASSDGRRHLINPAKAIASLPGTH
jgi:hypothetical protein